jgi:hypothetical protein
MSKYLLSAQASRPTQWVGYKLDIQYQFSPQTSTLDATQTNLTKTAAYLAKTRGTNHNSFAFKSFQKLALTAAKFFLLCNNRALAPKSQHLESFR